MSHVKVAFLRLAYNAQTGHGLVTETFGFTALQGEKKNRRKSSAALV